MLMQTLSKTTTLFDFPTFIDKSPAYILCISREHLFSAASKSFLIHFERNLKTLESVISDDIFAKSRIDLRLREQFTDFKKSSAPWVMIILSPPYKLIKPTDPILFTEDLLNELRFLNKRKGHLHVTCKGADNIQHLCSGVITQYQKERFGSSHK